ncbi:MAG: hypothetical protein IJN86_05095 [Clostridia bacterium]|nr:hypothetical protein [Clostridia bacterium]MBQ7048306.1 hypothetical protein [Clostridia bacterium]
MYSRGYENGIDSDGMLREYERSFEEERRSADAQPEEQAVAAMGRSKRSLFNRIDTEDLLIIAIVILILLDGNPDNDIILIALAALLFF